MESPGPSPFPSPAQVSRKQFGHNSMSASGEEAAKATPPAIKIQRRSSIKAINTSKYSAALDAVKSSQEADQDTLEDLRIKLKKYMSSSTFGKYYENVILLMGILSMFEFIAQTYLEDEPGKRKQYEVFLWMEYGFGGLFFFDWCLNIFLADHRRKYFTSFFSMVDILTVVSIFATRDQNVPTLFVGNDLQEILLYATFGCLKVRILRALRVQTKFVSIKDAVDRFLAELALYATVLVLFFTSIVQFLESDTQPFPFHTWLYYVWVTVATVGYGDITPHTISGRFLAMGMIAFALISVPKVTNELIEKMSLQSVYMRAVYNPKSRNSKHIVICGDLSSTSLQDFFGELFHEDHENVDLSAVILLPHAPSVELILLMRDPQFFLAIHYLEGSALVESDLRRARAESAQAMFIMSNKFSGNSDEEDAKSILLNLSIKRYLANYQQFKMLYCMQLIRPENRRHLADDESSSMKENDLVVCLNEIKMGAIAKAVVYPGANTLLMNLVSSFSDNAIEFPDDENVEGEESGGSNKASSRAWLEEYQQGCGWEIYTTSLSPLFKGAKFCELSYALYDRIGVVLFALQITDKDTLVSKMFLNPAEYIIPDQNKFTIEAFVIAENKASSDLSFSENSELEESNGSAMDRMRGNIGNFAQIIKSSVTDHTNDRRKSSTINNLKLNLMQHSTSLEQVKESDSPSSKKKEKKQSRWKQLKRSALLNKKVESFSYQEILHKLEDDHFNSNYYVQSPPLDLIDCTVKTGVIEEVPFINNHTIIIGKGLRNLYDLIRPLRAKYLGPLRYIVILFPHDIPHEVWQRISVFDAILFVRGSALEESNLRRAGIFRAAQVVVLADGTEGDKAHQGMEALVDSDAIFSYQHVKRMNPSTQVVIEIVNQSNIAYLNDEASPIDDHKFSPQFAAGSLFTTSLLDSIICQAYYNPQIIKVVNKLISGIDQAERSDLAAKATEEMAKNNAPEGEDSDSDSASASGKISTKQAILLKSPLNRIKGGCLYQIGLPEGLETKTYGAMYQHLAAQGIIPLGLFRGTFANMNMGPKANRMPYVFTNPDKATELFSCDRVYVLATTPQKVPGKVDMKDWLLDIQMQQTRQKEKSNSEASVTGIGSRPSIHMKGVEVIEKAQKKLDDRVTKLSTDVNKKLNSIMNMLEKMSAGNDQQFTSISHRMASSPSILKPGSPSHQSAMRDDMETPSRSRLDSCDTIASNEVCSLPEIQEIKEPLDNEVTNGGETLNDPLMRKRSSGMNGLLRNLKKLATVVDSPMTQGVNSAAVDTEVEQIEAKLSNPVVGNATATEWESTRNAQHSPVMVTTIQEKLSPSSLPDENSDIIVDVLPGNSPLPIEITASPSEQALEGQITSLPGNSTLPSAPSSEQAIEEEEQLTALKISIKPKASPKLGPTGSSKKIFTQDPVPQGKLFTNTDSATILGPSVAALASQNTDRLNRIRAVRMSNDRPVSAGGINPNLFFPTSDAWRNRSSTFDNTVNAKDDDGRKRAASTLD